MSSSLRMATGRGRAAAAPWHYPSGLDDASGLPNLTQRLLERGSPAGHTRNLGENSLRVFDAVWVAS